MKNNKLSTIFLAMFVAFFASEARADTGPPTGLVSLIQEGQDVEINIEDEYNTCHVTRLELSTEEEVTICDDRDFTEEESQGETNSRCYPHGVHEDCTKNPQKCSDCDGDGTNECGSSCYTLNIYKVTDPCVPPGQYRYTVSASLSGTPEMEITVEDTGDSCLGGDAGLGDADPDADPDAGPDADSQPTSTTDDDGGCSMAPSSPGATSTMLVVVMLGIGVIASLRRRPRRS